MGFLGILFLGCAFHGTTLGLVPQRMVESRITGTWVGTIRGNDQAVTAVFRLRQEGDRLQGTLRWNSPVSGVSVREVAGSFDPEQSSLCLEDVRFLQSDPNPLWMFCLVDQYQLVLDEATGRLRGEYWSEGCADRASLDLRRE
jgi:hypothetical protein